MKSQAPAEGGKDVQGLSARIRELEDVVTSQKSFMLEMGSKVHELELQLRRSLGAADALGVIQKVKVQSDLPDRIHRRVRRERRE